MSSLFTHAMYGFTIGVLFERHPDLKPTRKIGGVALCGLVAGVAPDLDVIPMLAGVPYGSFFGHRGFFHSPFFYLFFAPFLAYLTTLWSGIKERRGRALVLLTLCYFLALMSHSILDALTDGGRGIMLYFPSDSMRHFFSWQPIAVSPLGLQAFVSERGLEVIKSEAYFFVPALLLVILWRIVLRWKYGAMAWTEPDAPDPATPDT